jgi:hypothetical protein
MYCGSSKIRYSTLENSLYKIFDRTTDMYPLIMESPTFSIIAKKATNDPFSNSLGSWLAVGIYRDLRTSEPRDLIYAMLGLGSDCENGKLVPDYNKPLEQVYIDTVAFCEMYESGTIDQWFLKTLAAKLGLAFDKEIQDGLVQSFGATVGSIIRGERTKR